MNKRKKFTHKGFDVKLLDQLAQDEGSCVHVHKLQYHLALHPFHLNDLNTSVKDILNQEIAKYSARLDGILFGYKNIKFLSKLGQICEDSCFIHVDIEADFFIFKPVEGKTLQGIVNKISKDHVGCLVHKIFNVALPKSTHSKNWLGSTVNLNSEILFTINHTNFEGKLPYIRGEIVSILSNSVQDDSELNLENVTEDVKKAKTSRKLSFENNAESEVIEAETNHKKSKKRRKSVLENDMSEAELNFEDENENVVAKKRKKAKKQSLENNEENDTVEVESSPKKSKKRKRSLSEVDVTEEVPIKKKRKKSKNYDEEQT